MTTTTTTSPGFFELPAELRNEIYEIVFAPNCGELDATIDLLATTPPSKDLLLVSRQIYNEALKLYKACYRRFWSHSSFIMHRAASATCPSAVKEDIVKQQITALDFTGLEHIKELLVIGDDEESTTHKLLDVRGGWHISWDDDDKEDGRARDLIRYGRYSDRWIWEFYDDEDEVRKSCAEYGQQITMRLQLLDIFGIREEEKAAEALV